ncbi:DNA binding domain-containing protein, excisionase family [Mariprofundus ferrinatatus]|uniref:DNA binding domain-containing protein, excisionase family n=1 Tax=Mariprofundus ferrinatatus TaxID=1921087 RepID=A0A2K8L5W9_9PROT|nr:response regulator [Mariprofundus ferrinatatus]ATX82720.1 DNA binding domain-containing protein, excisionase family [Mariprofundus ferrinatatus]
MDKQKDYFTTIQASRLLNVSVRTIQLWCDSGELKAWVSPGGHRRIQRDSVMSLLQIRLDGGNNSINTSSRSILIVEDDPDTTMLYRMQIKKWQLPLDVRYVADGYKALIEIGKSPPDLLITDLYMPNIDGFKMLETLEQGDMRIPAIAVTGASAEDLEKIQAEHEDLLVLTKPIDFNLLRRLISTLLDLRNAARNQEQETA